MKLDQLYNQSEYFQEKCHFFRKNGSNGLFWLGVEYPGFTKIPLMYLENAKAELKRLGFLTYRSSWSPNPHPRVYRIFYQGPRISNRYHNGGNPSWTMKKDAKFFKIYFYSTK